MRTLFKNGAVYDGSKDKPFTGDAANRVDRSRKKAVIVFACILAVLCLCFPSAAAEDDFRILEITDEIFERIGGKTYGEGCPVPREDLRYLKMLHKDLEGNICEGEMIVNYHIAEDVLEIMKDLYEADYPVERIRLADEYDADDEASMEDNNTSAFNFRLITGTSKVSKHAYGLAVDINPLYNPYIKYTDSGAVLEPLTAEPYLDRDADFPFKITEDDLCCKLFTAHGFVWGGSWLSCKDYQHFEIPDETMAEWY